MLYAEVPLSNHRRLITRSTQHLGEGWLGTVELNAVVYDAIDMAVFPRQNDRSAGGADRIGNKAVSKKHALLGKSIQVWRFVYFGTVGTDSVRGMIISEDKEDIWPFRVGCCRLRPQRNQRPLKHQ